MKHTDMERVISILKTAISNVKEDAVSLIEQTLDEDDPDDAGNIESIQKVTQEECNELAAALDIIRSEMTDEQKVAYEKLKGKWSKISEPKREVCGNAYMVQCFYENGQSMWIGIEPDGYAHS